MSICPQGSLATWLSRWCCQVDFSPRWTVSMILLEYSHNMAGLPMSIIKKSKVKAVIPIWPQSRRSDIVSSAALYGTHRLSPFQYERDYMRAFKILWGEGHWYPLSESKRKKHASPVEVCSKLSCNQFHWTQLAKPHHEVRFKLWA